MPGAGPPALIAAPNDFASEAEARQLMAHHTYLDILAYEGPLAMAFEERGSPISCSGRAEHRSPHALYKPPSAP